MDIALQLLFTGLGVGSIYALVALGFAVIYRATATVFDLVLSIALAGYQSVPGPNRGIQDGDRCPVPARRLRPYWGSATGKTLFYHRVAFWRTFLKNLSDLRTSELRDKSGAMLACVQRRANPLLELCVSF
jgi:hypothetical protein